MPYFQDRPSRRAGARARASRTPKTPRGPFFLRNGPTASKVLRPQLLGMKGHLEPWQGSGDGPEPRRSPPSDAGSTSEGTWVSCYAVTCGDPETPRGHRSTFLGAHF